MSKHGSTLECPITKHLTTSNPTLTILRERSDCIMAHIYFIIRSLPVSSCIGHFTPLSEAWLQHPVFTNELHNLRSLNDPPAMLDPTSDNAFAWCRVHRSVMVVHSAPSTHTNAKRSHICHRTRMDTGTFCVQQPSGSMLFHG